MASNCKQVTDCSGTPIKVEKSDSDDSVDSRDTVKFDVSHFNSTLNNSKYKVHKNDAELLADFNKIMDGDVEEEDGQRRNGGADIDLTQNSKSSTELSRSMDSHDLLITPKKRDVPDKAEFVLSWTQMQAELSTNVASIFSDHDYLSQEHLIGNINGNVQQQRLNESLNQTALNSSKESDSPLSDSDSVTSIDMIELKECCQQLSPDPKSKQNRTVLKQIARKVEKIQSRLKEDGPAEQRSATANTSNGSLGDSASTSNKNDSEQVAIEFSSNHSEPTEYYAKIDTESGETSCDGPLGKLKESLNQIPKINAALCVQLTNVTNRLGGIKSDPTKEGNNPDAICANMSQFLQGIADDLYKMAKSLTQKPDEETNKETPQPPNAVLNAVNSVPHIEPTPKPSSADDSQNHSSNSEADIVNLASSQESTHNQSSVQKLNDAAKENLLADSMSTDSDATMLSLPDISHRPKKKLKKRKMKKNLTASESTFYTSSTDSDVDIKKATNQNQSQDSVVSQNIDELCKDDDDDDDEPADGTSEANNSPNDESIAENNSAEVEIGIKTELFSQVNPGQPDSLTSTTEDSPSKTTDSIIQGNDTESDEDGDSLDENAAEIGSSDEEDAEIRKLVDLSSLGIRRKAARMAEDNANDDDDNIDSGAAVDDSPPTTNHVTKKPAAKPQPKEDELLKILEAGVPDDSDEEIEKSDTEEIITEEQYLINRNDELRKQLCDSSSEYENASDDEFEEMNQVNGHSNDMSHSDSNIDEDLLSNASDTSMMETFLKFNQKKEKDKTDTPPDEASPANDSDAESENHSESASASAQSKEIILKSGSNKRKYEDDSDLDFSDEGNVVYSKKAKMSTVGKNIGAALEKDYDLILPSDDDDDGTNDKNKDKTSGDAKKNGESNGPLDTTMFKKVPKEISTIDLSKKLQSDRSKQLATTSRSTPDDVVSLSSDDDTDIEPHSTEKVEEKESPEEDKRKKRKFLREDQLADDTKTAQKEEGERIKRLEAKKKQLSQYIDSQKEDSQDSDIVQDDEILLDYDSKRKEKIVIHAEIQKLLKDHQIDGIKFMYDCCYGSVDNIEKDTGSGCILAHCMGLGKTLQLITLLHTVISYPQLKSDRILVICPKSTVMNWKDEIERWLKPIKNSRPLKLFQFPESSDINAKLKVLKEWSLSGKGERKQAGCLLIGYEAFRMLVFYHQSKKSKQNFAQTELTQLEESVSKYLLRPGADLVVCDEGHMIKNQKSATSLAVNKIKTRRRIVLTGTPIQNNLKEYYSMVNFIKPSFLGTEKEFANLYVNPIKTGQHKDSSKNEIKIMKQRSYVLHKKLSRFVQRREAALLKTFLPAKFEYVLFIPMTECQNTLYEYFLEHNPNKDRGGKSLIPDYTVLRKIWTHPKVLEKAYLNAVQAKTKLKAQSNNNNQNNHNNDSDDDQPDDIFDSQTGEMSVKNDWWRPYLKPEDLETILPSNKLMVLFEILDQCLKNNEKCLIFSAFVAVLDVVEFFMNAITKQNEKNIEQPGLERFRQQKWKYGTDYYRLDGKTPKSRRHEMITVFNQPNNEIRAFLISAKAGGQGINLIGANRVILLDTSWNPSNDQQNIFRVFRLGQKRVCYIYRLIAMGTMEEKVYSRSVTKQAMSFRVVDEQQIDRHYSMAELQELYILTKPDMDIRETPLLPKDPLLAHLLHHFPHMVYKYHEHDSLLENKSEQQLSEEEKADAWAAYEADVKRKNETNFGPYTNAYGMLPNLAGGLGSYTSPFYGNYTNMPVNYTFGSSYAQFSPFANDYNSSLGFSDYATFYNNLMSSTYNQSNTNLLTPNHAASVTSPSTLLNNFTSARNWMQTLASSSSSSPSSTFGNNMLSSLAQTTTPASKSAYNSYIDLCNRIGPTKNPILPTSNTSPPNSNSPPSLLPSTSLDFDPIAYLQQAHLSGLMGASLASQISPTKSPPTQQQQQQQQQQKSTGPNARNNPMLSKELMLPTRDPFTYSSIPTSVITKPSSSTATSKASSTNTPTAKPVDSNANKTTEGGVTSSTNGNANSINAMNNKRPAHEPQILIKNVVSLSDKMRNSPDTTKQPPNVGATNLSKAAILGSIAAEAARKIGAGDTRRPGPSSSSPVAINTAMNTAKPGPSSTKPGPLSTKTPNAPANPTTNASTVKISTPPMTRPSMPSMPALSSPVAAKPRPPSISVTKVVTQPKPNEKVTTPQLNKTNSQPMATIIKKPTTTTVDAATNAVQQINNNRALTVTSKRVPAPSENVKRSSALTNSISPINPQLKSNSPIPVAITRSPNAMQMIPTIVKAADPPSISVIPRTVSAGTINEQRPKTFMAKTSSVMIEKIPPKPITKSPTVHAPEQSNTAKRPRTIVHPAQIKKHSLSLSRRPAINNSRPIGISKSSSLANIRTIPRPSQQANADVTPMEIVELD